MRNRMAWIACLIVLLGGSFATWSLTRGQAPTTTTTAPPPPSGRGEPAPLLPAAPAATKAETPSPASPFVQHIDFSARRGSEWLFKMHGARGRFVHGFVPALNAVLEGDHHLRQAGAAFALARAARITRDESYAARATETVLSLLDETVVDPGDPSCRSLPPASGAVNRVGAAAMLVLAVSELPAPQADVLTKSEQLCQFLKKQQKPDGSISCVDEGVKVADAESLKEWPGLACYALLRSQQQRPASWKSEVFKKALAHYAPAWREVHSLTMVAWFSAACAEAYTLTKDKAAADFLFEMNDWLCGLQYDRLDPEHPAWLGGFMGWSNGKAAATAPDVLTASHAQSLAEACRVTRALPDLPRHRRYADALERSLQFLATLQYTDANTQHFNPWYRQRLVGGFHASHQGGELRIDFTQHAVVAMFGYLAHAN